MASEWASKEFLIKKIKTADRWRFAPIVPEANGRLKDLRSKDAYARVNSGELAGLLA